MDDDNDNGLAGGVRDTDFEDRGVRDTDFEDRDGDGDWVVLRLA